MALLQMDLIYVGGVNFISKENVYIGLWFSPTIVSPQKPCPLRILRMPVIVEDSQPRDATYIRQQCKALLQNNFPISPDVFS